MDLAFLSAVDAARALQQQKISSVELTEHVLGRIDRYNPLLKADALVDSVREDPRFEAILKKMNFK